MSEQSRFEVERLGQCKIPSPIKISQVEGDQIVDYVGETEAIIYQVQTDKQKAPLTIPQEALVLRAGPRKKVYFSSGHVHAGIATCGGLCPGLNNVIRSIVRSLWYSYGVRRITGIRNGYQGLLPECNYSPIDLNPDVVDDIHNMGGTILGSARGGGDRVEDIVDTLERMNINILFTIGGDGTLRGARDLAREICRRGLKISIVGIPKTIDNDISYLQKSFGFETAVARASEVVAAAHTEAHSAINGIGLVKLMGRESGFIAAYTAIAVHEANFVLIPEVPFEMEGPYGFLQALKKRMERRHHAVVIVAEGAGQNLLEATNDTDASGNKKLPDVGRWLQKRIIDFFAEEKMQINLKYINPSYLVRSSKADPLDSFYCSRLGTNAVHAAMAGMTSVMISMLNNHFVYLPIDIAVSKRNKVDPEGSLWRDVIESTQQPLMMKTLPESFQ